MNKKKLAVIILLLMIVIMTLSLTSCSKQVVDLDQYLGDDNGQSNLDLIGKFISWLHGKSGSMAIAVLVFTLFLKAITLPLDFWQRLSAKKNAAKTAKVKPLLDEIDRVYGVNTQRGNTEKQKVYKQHGLSGASSLTMCLPMIITMAIFFTMFGGLTSYSTYKNVTNYNALESFYQEQYEEAYQAYIDEGYTTAEATIAAVTVASQGGTDIAGNTYTGIGEYYQNNIEESVLWIANIWQPDTWASIMPTYDTFSSTIKLSGAQPKEQYDLIREQVIASHERNDNGSWNGLMILPLLSVGLSFLSMFVTQKLDRKRNGVDVPQDSTTASTNKSMMIMMPLMMAVFGFMYTGTFAIYMVSNYALSILTTIITKRPIDKIVEKALNKASENSDAGKANYMR